MSFEDRGSDSASARTSARGSAVNNEITWEKLHTDDKKAIINAIKEKRKMILGDGRICQLESFGENNNTIICKTGRVFKDTITIPIFAIIQKSYQLLEGGSKKMKKRGGSKRRRTKRLRKNKKTGRTRRSKI